jgi:hypothetical protein
MKITRQNCLDFISPARKGENVLMSMGNPSHNTAKDLGNATRIKPIFQRQEKPESSEATSKQVVKYKNEAWRSRTNKFPDNFRLSKTKVTPNFFSRLIGSLIPLPMPAGNGLANMSGHIRGRITCLSAPLEGSGGPSWTGFSKPNISAAGKDLEAIISLLTRMNAIFVCFPRVADSVNGIFNIDIVSSNAKHHCSVSFPAISKFPALQPESINDEQALTSKPKYAADFRVQMDKLWNALRTPAIRIREAERQKRVTGSLCFEDCRLAVEEK